MPQLTWLITGCSSGFGEYFIPSIVARGDQVIATAHKVRDIPLYSESLNVKILELDVTASQTELDSVIQEALAVFGGVDVLVNNAGYIQGGLMEEVRSVARGGLRVNVAPKGF